MNLLKNLTHSGSHDKDKEKISRDENWFVTVERAEGVEDKDRWSKSDTYAIIEFGDQKVRTHTINNSRTPFWNETFNLKIRADYIKDFHVRLMDDDFGPDDPIGTAVVSRQDLPFQSGEERYLRVPLFRKEQATGSIILRIKRFDNLDNTTLLTKEQPLSTSQQQPKYIHEQPLSSQQQPQYIHQPSQSISEQPRNITTSQPHNITTSQPHNIITSQPPIITSQPPITTSQQPYSTSQPHDVTISHQPHNITTSQQPYITSQPHDTVSHQPHNITTSQQPHNIITSEQPYNTSQPHVTTSHQPDLTTSHQPNVTTHQPNVTTSHQPNVTTSHQPNVTTSHQPNITTSHQPHDITTSHQPHATTHQPRYVVTQEYQEIIITQEKQPQSNTQVPQSNMSGVPSYQERY